MLTADTSGLTRGFAQAQAQTKALAAKFNAPGSAAGGMASQMFGLGGFSAGGAAGLAGGAAALGLAAMAKWAVTLAEQSKAASINFRVMLGDSGKAQALLGGIRDFAMNSPFGQGDLQNAAQTMLAFGMEGEKILPTLKAIGDISLGSAEKMERLSLAFAQSQAAGRLMGQDLLQMVNAGFNPLQEIARVTGKGIEELRKAMEKGAISAQAVALAFKSATEEGGRFHEAIKAQEKTLSGQWNKLKESIGESLRPGGGVIGDALQGTLKTANDILGAGNALYSGKILEYAASIQKASDKGKQATNELKKMFADGPLVPFSFKDDENLKKQFDALRGLRNIAEEGAKFAEKFRTPGEEFTAAVAEAAEFLRDGAISSEVYARAIAKAKEDLLATKDTAKLLQDALQPRQNTALSRNSAAAFSEINRAQQQQAADAEIARRVLAEEQKANAHLAKIEQGVNRGDKIKITEVDF